MRWLALVVVVAGCTEHGKGGGDEWDAREIQFAEAICQNACVPLDDQETCIVDTLTDMDQARAELSTAQEDACIECMRVKTERMPDIVANGCQSTPEIDAEITTACGEFDESCAGFP